MVKSSTSRGRRAVLRASCSILDVTLEALERRTLLCGFTPDVHEAGSLGAVPLEEQFNLTPARSSAVSTQSLPPGSYPTNGSGLPLLNSNPDAFAKLYLDFDGTASGFPGWNTSGSPSTFDASEQSFITDLWQRVSEKFSPFNINVTTVDPGNMNDRETGTVLIQSGSGASGGAPVGGFYGGGDYASVTGSIGAGARITSDVITHEAGHLMGMWHQSLYDANGNKLAEYFGGDANRAPIMGSPYGAQRGMWWSGPNSLGPNVIQDDLAYISGKNNAYGYRPDDHGDTIELADPLLVSGNSVSGSGLIEKMGDQDVFTFFAYGGAVDLDINVSAYSSMLDVTATLYQMQDGDFSFAEVASTSDLSEHLHHELEDSAYYFLVVEGAGGYGDLGTYTISGTIPGSTSPITSASNAKATPISASRVDLSWTDNSNNETGFRIERTNNDGASWSVVGSVGAGATSFSDLTTSANQTYYYRVVAFNASTGSDASNLARAVMTPGPANLQVVTVGYTKVTLSWADGASEIGYLIEKSTDGVNWTATAAAAGDSTSLQVTGLAVDTTYYFRVRSTLDGLSLPSSSVSAHTQFLAVPDAPTLQAAPYGPYYVTLNWSTVSGADKYRVERSLDGVSGWQSMVEIPAPYTSWSDYVNQPDSTFYFRVAAHNEAGWSAYSGVASAHTDPLGPPSAAPTNLRVDSQSGNSFVLTWDDNANNEDDYRVERIENGEWVFVEMAGEPDYPYHFTTLEPNSTYTYRVIAVNSMGESAPSNELTITTVVTSTPNAPSNFVAVYANETNIVMEWQNNATNASSLELQRLFPDPYGDDPEYRTIATIPSDVGDYEDGENGDLNPGEQQSYRLRAVNAAGTSAWVYLFTQTRPSAPYLNVVTAISDTQINLGWYNTSGETGYRIERSLSGISGWSVLGTTPAGINSFSNTGLTPSTTYYYRIIAESAVGDSVASNVNSATTPATPVPAQPNGVSATAVSTTQVNVSWTDGAAETGYRVERSFNSTNGFASVGTVGANVTSFSDTTASAGTSYYYRVVAFNGGGDSPASTSVFAITIPGAPSGLAASVMSATQVNLSWSNVTGNSGYKVERSANGGANWTQIGTSAQNVASFSDTAAASGTTYQYRVKAYNSSGDSAPSASVTATTVPNAPAGLSATTVSATRIDLSWSDVTGETSFKIQRSTDGINWTQIGSTVNLTSFSDTTATAGTSYSYRVIANNAGGDSTPSASASATTVTLAPTGLAATAVSTSQINLTWSDVAGETGYRIERSTNGTTWSSVGTVAANVTSFSNTGLTAGTLYQYRVIATNAGGDSVASSVASVTTIPAAPAGLTATAISATQINLAWSDVAGDQGYIVERSLNGTTWTQVGTTAANVTSFSNTGLSPNTSYTYRVRAIGASGNSANSNTATATTPQAPPAAPSNLVATALTNTSIGLTWTDNSTNESGFRIERSLDGISWTLVTTVAANTTTYTNTGLKRSTKYYYRVIATNSAGNSPASNTATATTPK